MQKNIKLTAEQARAMLGKDGAMDALIKANFTEDELRPEPWRVRSWNDLGDFEGYYIDSDSQIKRVYDFTPAPAERNVFKTKNQARGVLAMAQLSQLMHVYNEGWVPVWDGRNTYYTIECLEGRITLSLAHSYPEFLAFKSATVRNAFYEDHKDLIEEYFLIHKPD